MPRSAQVCPDVTSYVQMVHGVGSLLHNNNCHGMPLHVLDVPHCHGKC